MGPDDEVVQPLGTTQHPGLTGRRDRHGSEPGHDGADLAFIKSVIQDLMALADMYDVPAIRHGAEAASDALAQEQGRFRATNDEVVH